MIVEEEWKLLRIWARHVQIIELLTTAPARSWTLGGTSGRKTSVPAVTGTVAVGTRRPVASTVKWVQSTHPALFAELLWWCSTIKMDTSDLLEVQCRYGQCWEPGCPFGGPGDGPLGCSLKEELADHQVLRHPPTTVPSGWPSAFKGWGFPGQPWRWVSVRGVLMAAHFCPP